MNQRLSCLHKLVSRDECFVGREGPGLVKRAWLFQAAFLALLLLEGFCSRGQTIAQWTFETSQPRGSATGNWFTNISAEVGAGTASVFHNVNRGVFSPPGNGSAHSLSSSNWAVGDFYQFALSTSGYSKIGLTFDIASSGNGPGTVQLEYSVNGTSFSNIGSSQPILVNGSPNPFWNTTTYNPIFTMTYDLSAIADLDNADTVYFRLVDPSTGSAAGGSVAPTGTEIVDNFTVSIVPEPRNLPLLAVLLILARIFHSSNFRKSSPPFSGATIGSR
jgi:hypothetical protein